MQLNADLDRDLDGRAARFESFFRSESAESGVHVSEELEEFCQALPPGSYINRARLPRLCFSLSGGITGAVGVPSAGTEIQREWRERSIWKSARRLADITHFLSLLRLLLWSLIPVVIALGCIGGAWLSGRALKPVQDVTKAALAISIENLSGRLPVPATGDEIASLAAVLNSMLARLEAAVTTLSQFAGDASHELRTPLAVIRTTAELALAPRTRRRKLIGPRSRRYRSESERMTQLVEDLLAWRAATRER